MDLLLSSISLVIRIVLVEGNYLLLDISPWTELRKLLDDIW
jgi:pantothenate kinase